MIFLQSTNMKNLLALTILISLCFHTQAELSKTVTVTQPGTLSTLLTADELSKVTELTLTGTIDQRDFLAIHDAMPALTKLDLRQITIAAYTYSDSWGVTNYEKGYIPYGAFWDKKKLTTVLLPDNLIGLGNYCFCNCTGLKDMVLPNSVITIGTEAFDNCSSLSSIKLSANLNVIQDYALTNCSTLTTIDLPKSLKKIGFSAFSNCTNLRCLTIPDSVTQLGGGAFFNCSNLKSITISASVSNLYHNTFKNCTLLDTIRLLSYEPIKTNTEYSYESQAQEDLNKQTCTILVPYRSAAIYRASKSWKDFLNIVENESGVLPAQDSLTYVSEMGATGTIDLTSNASWSIHSDKPWLKVYPNSGTGNARITYTLDANDTFQLRSGNLILVDVNQIAQKLFFTQLGMKRVIVNSSGNLTRQLNRTEKSTISNLKLTGTMDARDFKLIKDSMPVLDKLDLSEVGITGYVGNGGTTENYDFTYLKDEIPESAFYTNIGGKGKKIKTILLPKNLSGINRNAFMKCNLLSEIHLPKTVSKIGCQAFDGCTGLRKIEVGNPAPVGLSICWYDYGVFNGIDTSITTLSIPYRTKSAYLAANQWNKFTRIEESPNYLEIGATIDRVDDGHQNLLQHDIHSNVQWTCTSDSSWLKVVRSTGTGDEALTYQVDANTSLGPRSAVLRIRSAELDDALITIVQDGKGIQFNQQAGTLRTAISPTLKKKLTHLVVSGSMDARDFKIIRDSMPSLIKLNLSKASIKYYNGADGTLDEFYQTIYPANELPSRSFTYYNENSVLRTVILPDSLISINYCAFDCCVALEEVTFGNVVKTIGSSAFYKCRKLTKVILPPKLTTLGTNVFQYCTGLNEIYLPGSLTKLDANAFGGCTNLKTIQIYASNPGTISLGSTAFYQVPTSNCRLNVPTGCKEVYSTAAQWMSFNTITEGLPSIVRTESISKLSSASPIIKGYIQYFDPNLPTQSGIVVHMASRPTLGQSNRFNLANTVVGNFSLALSSLEKNKTYYARTFAVNSLDTCYGSEINFLCPNRINLTISPPVVVKNKMYDGTTSAAITKTGTLSGVQPEDVANVTVLASAKYNDAAPGSDKRITVSYLLTGNASDSYVAPEDTVISPAKISDFVTLLPLNEPEPGCEGNLMDLIGIIHTGTPTEYKLTFDASGISAGLKSIGYLPLQTIDSLCILPFALPESMPFGEYSGYLTMRNELMVESPRYAFSFTVNVSPKRIISKFNDVVLFDNWNHQFVGYQWYKDGSLILGATHQYYCDPEGLSGNYSVELTKPDGSIVRTCPKPFYQAEGLNAVIAPNPARVSQECHLRLDNTKDGAVCPTTIQVFDLSGNVVQKTTTDQSIATLRFSTTGTYFVHVQTPEKSVVFKMMVIQ